MDLIQVIKDISEFINTVGFPVFVAVFSLLKLDKTINKNTMVMQSIATKLNIAVGEEK